MYLFVWAFWAFWYILTLHTFIPIYKKLLPPSLFTLLLFLCLPISFISFLLLIKKQSLSPPYLYIYIHIFFYLFFLRSKKGWSRWWKGLLMVHMGMLRPCPRFKLWVKIIKICKRFDLFNTWCFVLICICVILVFVAGYVFNLVQVRNFNGSDVFSLIID